MDIYLTHELQMGVYNRVSLVYPDGRLDVISSKEFYNHYRYFMYYILKKEHEVPEVFPLYKNAVRDPFSYVQSFLNYYHAMVILDTTFMDEDPTKFTAQVYVPYSITEEQYEKMKEQRHYFNQYELWMLGGNKEVTMKLLEDMGKWNMDEIFSPIQYDQFLEALQYLLNKKKSR